MTSPARRAARRHEDEIGRVLSIHHDRPGPRTVIGFAVAWVLMSALTFIVPGETALLAVVPTLAFLVILGVILVMLSGERLIIGERGILLGSVAPLLTPYVLRYDQIVPGTVVPISGGIRRYARQTGLSTMTTVRTSWWSERGISLVGPDPASARPTAARLGEHRLPLAHRHSRPCRAGRRGDRPGGRCRWARRPRPRDRGRGTARALR